VPNLFDGLIKLGFTNIPKTDSVFDSREFETQTVKPDEDGTKMKDETMLDYVFLKKRICPVCDRTFPDVTLKEKKCRYKSSDSDLRAHYEPFQPFYYDVVLCHNCGYAAMHSHFDQIFEKQTEKILEVIMPQYSFKEYPLVLTAEFATERYLLALFCSTVKKSRASEKAMLCLRLAWLAQDQNQSDQERMYREYALKGFEMAFQSESFPIYGMESPAVMYLMGELSRRVGKKENALKYISRVLAMPDVSSRLKERAREVKELMS